MSVATATEAELQAILAQRFRIVRQLGSGGMGTVFLAEQIAVGNRPVALKVLLRKLLDDPEFLLRFRNEAASTGRIRHPNVVTIHESGQAEDGTPYIAMEYLEGGTLRQALRSRGAFPVEECAAIIQQVARGLAAAHKLGIIHRDLKPDNIFLTKSDDDVGEGSALPREPGGLPYVVKVVDFGIAKLRESATHTLTGTVLGTPAYMSFEQASGMRSDELDARSDIYSLGVVAYEMLTGRVPFHSDTPLGYVRKHLSEEPPPFRAVKPELSRLPRLEQVVMKALAKDREMRYGSALEFAREFVEAMHHMVPGEAAGTAQAVETEPRWPAKSVAGPSGPAPEPGSAAASRAEADRGELAVKTPPPTPGPSLESLPARHAPDVDQGVSATPLDVAAAPNKRRAMTYVVVGGLAVVAIASAIWYLLRPRPTVEINAKDGLKYVAIPPGAFMMGCSPGDRDCGHSEKPPHQVTITKGYWMGQTEITVGAYKRFVAATGRETPPAPAFNVGLRNDNLPMVNVSWDDAQAYCTWAGGRLPTEAEWEYAARAGTEEARSGELADVAWYKDNSGGRAHEVAQKRPNAWGLYDVLGNVGEWVEDWHGPYSSDPATDPRGPSGGEKKVLRGGSWEFGAKDERTSYRNEVHPGSRGDDVGFRCARER